MSDGSYSQAMSEDESSSPAEHDVEWKTRRQRTGSNRSGSGSEREGPSSSKMKKSSPIYTSVSASTSVSVSKLVARACDQCHTRRVKCDGEKPCSRCTKGGVTCTYDKPKLKKGPAPGFKYRARVQAESQLQSSQPEVHAGDPSGSESRRRISLDSASASASASSHGQALDTTYSSITADFASTDSLRNGGIASESRHWSASYSPEQSTQNQSMLPFLSPGRTIDKILEMSRADSDTDPNPSMSSTSPATTDAHSHSNTESNPWAFDIRSVSNLSVQDVLRKIDSTRDAYLTVQRKFDQPSTSLSLSKGKQRAASDASISRRSDPYPYPKSRFPSLHDRDRDRDRTGLGTLGNADSTATSSWHSTSSQPDRSGDLRSSSRPENNAVIPEEEGQATSTSFPATSSRQVMRTTPTPAQLETPQYWESLMNTLEQQVMATSQPSPRLPQSQLPLPPQTAESNTAASHSSLLQSNPAPSSLQPSPTFNLDALVGSSFSILSPENGFGTLPTSALPPFATPPACQPLQLPPFISVVPPDEISPIFTLTLDSMIRPQIDIYFARINPMIPVFTQEYIYSSLSDPVKLQSREHVAMILAMTALSLVHPLNADEVHQRPTRARHAAILMDEALRISRRWDFGCTASFEACMTSYFLFGLLHEMEARHGAKLRLREAISLGETMGLNDANTYAGLKPDEVQRRIRLYWILSVTERAYAIQRSGNIVFEGPISIRMVKSLLWQGGGSDKDADTEPISRSLRYLAQLFSVFDQDLVACWNGQCDRVSCRTITQNRAVTILSRLDGTAQDVFGEDFDQQITLLTQSQRADLLITWQWLKNRIWRLANLHGLTREDGPPQLKKQFVYDVAVMTLAICQTLTMPAMEAHGTGFVEKLYDIISLVPAILRGKEDELAPVEQVPLTKLSEVLGQLFGYVAAYRMGDSKFVAPLAGTLSKLSLTASVLPV